MLPIPPLVRALFLAGLTLSIALPATKSAAIGICENLETTYQLKSVSEKTGQLRVDGQLEWCEEIHHGAVVDERRGALRFSQIRTLKGEVLGWYLKHLDRRSLARLPAEAKDDLVKSRSLLDTYEKQNGFVPIQMLRKSPSARCKGRAVMGRPKDSENGFPAATAYLRLMVNGKRVARESLGLRAAALGTMEVLPLFMPIRREIWIWTSLPRCTGGPPPGYFGPDDPGECYLGYDPQVLILTAAARPELAPCFEPAAARPPAETH